jgi:hypothetical protein
MTIKILLDIISVDFNHAFYGSANQTLILLRPAQFSITPSRSFK